MREFSIEENLHKTLDKLFKKDRETYKALMNKMQEILSCSDVNHYKNLRKPLQHLKRVHIYGPFILTFKYVESTDTVIFYNFDNHDNIYKKK